MKQEIILLSMVMIVVLSFPAFSQVSINTDGTDPDASAMLDVKSTAGGMLVPRMTQAERNNINGGVFETGLLIYQTDNIPGFYYYDGSTWQRIVGGDDGDWTTSGNNIYSTVSGNVGIGTTNPSQKLEVNGNMRLTNKLYDENNSSGSSGEVLSATATGVDWITNPCQKVYFAQNNSTQTFTDSDDWHTLTSLSAHLSSGNGVYKLEGNMTLWLTEGSNEDPFDIRVRIAAGPYNVYTNMISFIPDQHSSSDHDNPKIISYLDYRLDIMVGTFIFNLEVRNTGDDGWAARNATLFVTEY